MKEKIEGAQLTKLELPLPPELPSTTAIGFSNNSTPYQPSEEEYKGTKIGFIRD